MKINLKSNQQLLAEHTTNLPDGTTVVTEIVKQGDSGILVGSFLKDGDDLQLLSWCGYCDGVLIGCVDCPNNDPYLNCVNGTITCGS